MRGRERERGGDRESVCVCVKQREIGRERGEREIKRVRGNEREREEGRNINILHQEY